MKRILIAALAAASLASAASAQVGFPCPTCPRGGCPSVYVPGPAVLPAQAAAAVEWRHRADAPNEVYLYLGGRQVGGIDRAHNVWRSIDAAGQWGPPVDLFPGMIPASVGVPE